MANASSLWARAYLQAICAHPTFSAAMGVAPLWLAHESSAEPATQPGVAPLPAARVTIQMAAEMFPRMAVIGQAGAGKTTLLRQLTRVLAETILAEETQARRGGAVVPLPLYIELVRFEHNIEATLADAFNLGPPPSLGELTRQRPLLLLLDGLEELAPDVQLAGLSALAQTLTQLGTHARWITTCRPENLPLFRPWLGAVEVRSIRPLPPRDVIAFLQRQHADALGSWIERADDLIALASRARWLAALAQLDLAPPSSRGRLMAAWLASVLAATTEAHPALGSSEAALTALPILADALDKRRQNTLALAEVDALFDAAAPAMTQLLIRAGLLTCDTERRQVAFSHPALRSFAQALSLGQTQPDTWPAAIFTRAWNETIVFAYSLCDDREALLRRLLSNGAVQLAARCLIDTEPRDNFEALLERSGTLTPPLRVMLAEAFAAEGLTEAAREQLERAGMEGYDEAGLFGRLGELYCTAGQWNHARAAYEQALARDPEGMRYRQQLGIVYSRLGALDEAAAALQAVIKEQQRHSAEAAFELGHIYLNQGQFEQALAAYQQASASRPDEPAYQRGIAAALRRMGRLEAAELLLRNALDQDDSDPLMHAELGRVYADTGRPEAAIACYARAITLLPDSAEYYYQIGQLRAGMGDLPGARAALQRATELDPYDATLHYALGKACEDAGEQESAIAAYRYTARLDEQNEACLRRLGALLRERGADAEAAQALQAALELCPDSAETHEELATLLWRQGQHDQALELYERAIAIAPHEARYQYAISLAYRQLGRQQESMRHALRATELAPDDAAAHHAAATAAEALQDWDVALASYERAVALEPGRPEYIRAAGALYLKRGHGKRARALLAAALRYDRRNAATLQQVALLHAADAAWPRAIRALRRIMRVERSASVYDQLGRALMAAGHVRDARAAFEQALEITHGDPAMLFHYSRALDACGQSELAYDIARQSTRRVVEE